MYSWLWKRGEPRAVDEYDAQIFPTLGKRMCKGSFEITQTKVWQNKGELDNLIFSSILVWPCQHQGKSELMAPGKTLK